MKKFEYKTFSMPKTGLLKQKKSPDEKLNKLGQEGWECVSVYAPVSAGTSTEISYLFKREIG
ncbi:DUF4177 domain-containing protein [Metabacillus halosaccharovorans]|uniref:DUF4177 domain-containing protein n=1 Tax=Metabacillus halosaccharovorans TaxID=930124 RepID=UPI0037366881